MYNDDTLISNGKYKMERLRFIPSEYLLNIINNGGNGDLQLKEYISNNIERIKSSSWDEVKIESVKYKCDKVTYPTQKDAKEALKKIRESGGDDRKPQRVYECPDCSGWHLTSKDYKTKKELKKW